MTLYQTGSLVQARVVWRIRELANWQKEAEKKSM